MKTTLTLVRHGKTEWNALGKFQGCQDISLSMEGILQAEFLKERFKNNFDCIYTSPLKRADETAKIICGNTNTNIITSYKLREINFGDWEGLTIKEIEYTYPENFNKWKTDELEGPLCGGDLSIKKASIRAKEEILEIVKKEKGKNIIIVAHGGIIKAALICIFNWQMTMYHKITLGNTAVCKLKFDDDLNPFLITLNDTRHLPNHYSIKSYV